MQIETFIPCRLGEPLTAVRLTSSGFFFGSISGYIGKFNFQNKALTYFPNCMNELIRDICIHDKKIYCCVGDQFIAVHEENDLSKIEDVQYEDFKHKDLLCGAYFSYIAKSTKQNKVTAILSLFPTSEVEKQSILNSHTTPKRSKTSHNNQTIIHGTHRN